MYQTSDSTISAAVAARPGPSGPSLVTIKFVAAAAPQIRFGRDRGD